MSIYTDQPTATPQLRQALSSERRRGLVILTYGADPLDGVAETVWYSTHLVQALDKVTIVADVIPRDIHFTIAPGAPKGRDYRAVLVEGGTNLPLSIIWDNPSQHHIGPGDTLNLHFDDPSPP